MDKSSAKERLIIKLVCVLLSFGLWIYVTNVETTVKTYTLKNVPVKLVNVDALKNAGLALAPGQTFEVNLNLEGPSKYIYSVDQSNFDIQADLSEYALKKGENNIPVQIINYPQQLNIKNNGYLIVKVKLESLETKTFTSVSQVDVTFAQNVYKDSIGFTPEQIQVSGPQSAVNAVAKVALVGTLNDVSESTNKIFKYEPLDANGNIVKGVDLSKKTGEISIATNSGKKVPITAEFTGNLPSGITLVSTELSQNYVNIVGNKQSLENVSSLKTAPIDLSNIKADTKQTVTLNLPNGVKLANGETKITVAIDVSGNTDNNGNNNNGSNNNNSGNTNPGNQGGTTNEAKTITIPVTFSGLDKSLKLGDNQSSISIKITGSKDVIDNIAASDFTATADLSSYKNPGTYTVTPKVTTTKNVVIESIPDVQVTVSKAETVSADKKQV